MGALKDWANENWVDIGAPKKDGKYQPCGRKNAKTSKRKYPKCVPAAKAAGMSKSQKASAVSRKRAKAQGVGGKPTMVKTKGGGMAKKKFPDLSGDGKVTQKDILMGRGVVKKAVVGKLITKAAKAISKKISKRKVDKEFERFELGMDKYLGQTVAKKKYKRLPKFTSDAAKVTAGVGLGAAAEKRKKSKTVKGKAQGGSVKGKDKYGEYTSKLVKKGKNFNLEDRTYTKKGKHSPTMRTAYPNRLFDSTGEARQLLGMEGKSSQSDIIGKGSPTGRDKVKPQRKAQGGMMTKGQGAAIRGNNFKGIY